MQVYSYLREICSWQLLNHDAPLMLVDWVLLYTLTQDS